MEMHGVCNASSLTATDSEKAAAQHGRLDTGTPSVVQKRRDFADSGGVEIRSNSASIVSATSDR